MQVPQIFPYFADIDGEPLNSGYVYIGTANANPETSPISVYWDAAFTQPAAQPLRTINGFVVRNGTLAKVFVSSDFSITIRNKNSVLVSSYANQSSFEVTLSGSGGSALVGFTQAGVGAISRTVQTELREMWVSVKQFGATGDGLTDDTAAFAAAALTGKSIHIPYGDYIISSPVTFSAGLHGDGADDGQSHIILTGTGQLVVGDWQAEWSGFFVSSAVNNLSFIKNPGMSYWRFTNFRLEATGGATGQKGIEFNTTTASIYSCNVDNFKIKVSYPCVVTGNTTQVFNANCIGKSIACYWQSFATAVTIENQLACDANQFAGYLETGTNAVSLNINAVRQNRFKFVLDAVTNACNSTGVTITDPNYWEILSGGFVVVGTYPQNQILVGPTDTKVRCTDSSAQSIPNASATKLTFNVETFDSLSEFVNGTGIFTAKNAGFYNVEATALSASAAWPLGTRWEMLIFKNGAEYAKGNRMLSQVAGFTGQFASSVSAIVQMNGTTDTLDVRAIHNQGGAVLLDNTATANHISITRV